MRNIAFFYEFQKMYLYKDLFLMPYYIAKQQEMELEFCYSYNMGNEVIPKEYRNVKLHGAERNKANIIQRNIDFFKFCTLKAKQINTLFTAGVDNLVILQFWIIKHLNPNCNIVVFGDMEPDAAKRLTEHDFVMSKGINGWIKKKIIDFFFNNVIYTVANNLSYKLMKDMYVRNGWNNLTQVYPCLDNELFDSLGLNYRPFEEKENIILSVGRIGNYQKNTDMMLDAFKKVDFKNWKVFMIGPITDSFFLKGKSGYEEVIEQFFNENPSLREYVFFTGPIYDPKTIFEFYLRSKVFLLTSRHEGFGNVQSEAAALGCYTVSTDVGGADIVSNNWQFGTKIEQEDSDGLADVLNKITHGDLEINLSKQIPMMNLTWENIVAKKLLPFLK